MPDESVTKNLSEAFTRTLPFLRRYARAVSGSQQRGDEWVRLCAEVAVQQPELIAKSADTKLGVFKLFHSLQQPFGGLERSVAVESVSGRLKESLTEMAPLQRQVLLLTVLEGFTVGDAAEILGVDIDTAERGLAEARQELQRVAAVRVLVIEDEAIISADIESLVKELGHRVTGTATTHDEAVDAVARHRPGLVLADIQLADGSSGIDAVKDILGQFNVPVIFITAFPERLLTGERPEPTFLITKPYQPENIWEVVGVGIQVYKPDSGENLYRRSLYNYWRRMAPPASLDLFNAPSREVSCVRRDRTNTPLQALVMLNDPQYVEASRVLAQHTLQAGGDDLARLNAAALRLLSRPLKPAETAILTDSLGKLRAHYVAQPGDAAALLGVGDSKSDEKLPKSELAAWTMVCSQLLNLDEVLNK